MNEHRMETIGELDITLSHIHADGWILDLFAGGEGVIGQLMGERVVAIDASRQELEEAPAGPLKVVMDARRLQFLDGTFSVATSFFGFLYMADDDLPAVFAEVYRVLAPGGRFHIWDCRIPARPSAGKDIALCHVRAQLPHRVIATGYGAIWPSRPRGADSYCHLAGEAGFEAIEAIEDGALVRLTFRKR